MFFLCNKGTMSPVLFCFFPPIQSSKEMGSGNTSQKSDEEDFVKVEDLPLQLTVMCEVREH